MIRDKQHILVHSPPTAETYKPHKSKMRLAKPPMPADRSAWADTHGQQLNGAFDQADARRQSAHPAMNWAPPGIYLTFESIPDFTHALKSLDSHTRGWELVAVKQDGARQLATVFMLDSGRRAFMTYLSDFARGTTPHGGVPHRDMLTRIDSIQLSTLDKLWTESQEPFPPPDELRWWEVWLRADANDRGAEVARFRTYAQQAGMDMARGALAFRDRSVVLARATARQLSGSLDVLADLGELRAARPLGSAFVEMEPAEAHDWAQELAARIVPASEFAPTVCVLDTGITRNHVLLAASVAEIDCHAFDPDWEAHDNGGLPDQRGHGTEMAGIGLLGNLRAALLSTEAIHLEHGLESVKILPPGGANLPEHYGLVTAGAITWPETQARGRDRVFLLAVGDQLAGARNRGQPSSWSATLDALAVGRQVDTDDRGITFLNDPVDLKGRLFVVAAGNVRNLEPLHLEKSDDTCADDPAQSWNALTVGGYTDFVALPDERGFRHHGPLAPAGELSPHSATSVPFGSKWPIKPEILLEAGNAVLSPQGQHVTRDDSVGVLTTYHAPSVRPFACVSGTSPAAAEAARLAAILGARYPSLWPETTRALLVDSAEWTDAMRQHFVGQNRTATERLLRRYGYGVASLERASASAANSVTMIVQSELQPYRKGAMREMHLHTLPWPSDILQELEATQVRLRVTLSYFVEPNPSRRGWSSRFRYASHQLRFHLIGADQDVDEFKKRLNAAALDEEEERPPDGDDDNWKFGTRIRNKGSLHTDVWEGPASDLARRSLIGIVPTGGWWKDQPKHDRSEFGVRYALVVSIESPEVEVDLWSAVAAIVGVTV